jgi:hypothetical protein
MNLPTLFPALVSGSKLCLFLARSAGWLWIQRIMPPRDPNVVQESVQRADPDPVVPIPESRQSAVRAPDRNARRN